MSRKCPVTGKGPLSGNNRSHSLRATRRVQNVNLQKFKVNINGKLVTIRMSARAYRALMKNNTKTTKPENKPVEKKVEAKADAKVETKAETKTEAK